MRFLFTWELGGGWGHIARFSPVARALLERGHELVAVVCDPKRTAPRIAGASVLPLPALAAAPEVPLPAPATFADILYTVGWHDANELDRLTTAWLDCIDQFAPDVMVMDYSPTALLASQGRNLRRVLLSTGFTSPPDVAPLPNLQPVQGDRDTEEQKTREEAILARMNRFMRATGSDPLQRVAQLFKRIDLDILATLPELDHYGARAGALYSGVWTDTLGERPAWPAGRGPRVFVYLKAFPALADLLHMLRRSGLPVLAYLSDVTPALVQSAATSVRIVESPMDLEWAARESDLAVLNAGHGATAIMLLAGTPILEIPMVLEQFRVAQRVAELGAGQVASQDSPEQIAGGLQRLLTDMRFTRRAKAFAKRHRGGSNSAQQVERIVERILSVAS